MVLYERLLQLTVRVREPIAVRFVVTLLGLGGVCEGRCLHLNEIVDDCRKVDPIVVCLAARVLREWLTAQRTHRFRTFALEFADLRADTNPETLVKYRAFGRPIPGCAGDIRNINVAPARLLDHQGKPRAHPVLNDVEVFNVLELGSRLRVVLHDGKDCIISIHRDSLDTITDPNACNDASDVILFSFACVERVQHTGHPIVYTREPPDRVSGRPIRLFFSLIVSVTGFRSSKRALTDIVF